MICKGCGKWVENDCKSVQPVVGLSLMRCP